MNSGKWIAVLFIALAPTAALPQCIEGDCVDGEGKYRYANGHLFEGEFLNRLPREGILTYNDGDVFEGTFDANGRRLSGVYRYGPRSELSGFIIADSEPPFNEGQIDISYPAYSLSFDALAEVDSEGFVRAFPRNPGASVADSRGSVLPENSTCGQLFDFATTSLCLVPTVDSDVREPHSLSGSDFVCQDDPDAGITTGGLADLALAYYDIYYFLNAIDRRGRFESPQSGDPCSNPVVTASLAPGYSDESADVFGGWRVLGVKPWEPRLVVYQGTVRSWPSDAAQNRRIKLAATVLHETNHCYYEKAHIECTAKASDLIGSIPVCDSEVSGIYGSQIGAELLYFWWLVNDSNRRDFDVRDLLRELLGYADWRLNGPIENHLLELGRFGAEPKLKCHQILNGEHLKQDSIRNEIIEFLEEHEDRLDSHDYVRQHVEPFLIRWGARYVHSKNRIYGVQSPAVTVTRVDGEFR